MPMEKAEEECEYRFEKNSAISVNRLKWPLSVIRVRGNREDLTDFSFEILEKWRVYSDPATQIFAFSKDKEGKEIPHNTITPIARKKNGLFEIDLVLRNNRATEEHPLGLFHPHEELHHIKKENIGLIEVMGLAILPGRLKKEFRDIAEILCGKKELSSVILSDPEHPLFKHKDWIIELKERYGGGRSLGNAVEILKKETGIKFSKVLEDSGVFKRTEEGIKAFEGFLFSCGIKKS